MANPKKISIVWEEKQIALLEVDKGQPVLSRTIDLSSVNADESAPMIGMSEDIQLVGLIQKTLRDMRVDSADTYIGVANKDVILRTFVLPFLKSSEIQTALQFEAKKYIPFELDELKYSYHTFTVVDGKMKRLRVIFYAVRKDLLEKYERIMKQTGLTLVACQPAAVGLCRGMLHQKDMTADSQTALLDVNRDVGKVYFFDRGVVVFIREFQLNTPLNTFDASPDPDQDAELYKTRLYNEVRNSFDFYNRQYADPITQVLVFGNDDIVEFIQGFQGEIGVTVRRYNAGLVTPAKSLSGVEVVSGFGLTLSLGAAHDFLVKQKVVKESFLASLPPIDFDVKDFKPALHLALVLLVVCAGVFGYTFYQKQELNKQVYALASQQGEFEAQAVGDLEAKIAGFSSDMDAVRKLRLKTDLHVLTLLISKHLSDSMWINGLDVKFSSENSLAVNADFQGNVYLPDPNAQIKAVNDFIAKLRADKNLGSHFSKIQLLNIERKQANGVTFTSFAVKCT